MELFLKLGGVAFLSYLAGSIPFSYMIAKYFKGIDLRKVGSGNPGATNVYRTCGFKYAVNAFALDALKGFLAVYFFPGIFFDRGSEFFVYARIIAFFFVMAGHNWTFLLNFKGGKGVATSAGALIAISWKIFAIIFLIWWVLLFLFRKVSLSSILSALSFPILLYFFRYNCLYVVFGTVLAIIIVIRHKDNIRRMLKGEEKNIYGKKEKNA